MVINLAYWAKVLKRICVLILSIIGIFIAIKLSIFYMPFLIALIIALILEPVIKFFIKNTSLNRKISSIIVLIVFFGLIIGLSTWGITRIIAESSNLLNGLNEYVEEAYKMWSNFIEKVDFDKINVSDDVKIAVEETFVDFLGKGSNAIKSGLTKVLNILTSIPTMLIYASITLISLYFITTDKVYIIDQMEHHLPRKWVNKICVHLSEILHTLGGYLKAQVVLIVISFFIVLIGLILLQIMDYNIEYPVLAAIGIGFVDALPILGTGTVMIPWIIISFLNNDLKLSIALTVIYIIVVTARQLLEPKIVGRHIGIHPIFTLLAMYTGFKFIGVMGMFVGPILLIILNNIYGTLLEKGVVKTILDRK